MSFNKKVAYYTLGCKVNQYETESIKNQLTKIGYDEVSFDDKADVYIINSCTVTSMADKKTRNILRRVKKNSPNSILILTGCYAQTNSSDLKEFSEIDYIIGNKDKQGVVKLLQDIDEKLANRIISSDIFQESNYEEYEFATLREMSRAYIKIQDGCNSFCSYCKIPFARGKSRSRKIENIIKEIEKVTEQGYKEIILIGINIGSYGEDFENPITFEVLVNKVLTIKGVERIRFGSIYPDKISNEFIELFKNEKVLPHVHLSLQSGDDSVLQMMNRKYDTKLIQDRCGKIKSSIEGFELTADVIVGFPGETDEMFKNTYSTIKSIGFSDLHVFQYSEREGTRAATFQGKLDEKTKKNRSAVLEVLREEMRQESMVKYIGTNMDILVEENKKGDSLGHTSNYLRGKIKNSSLSIGEIYKVKVIGVDGEVLICEDSK